MHKYNSNNSTLYHNAQQSWKLYSTLHNCIKYTNTPLYIVSIPLNITKITQYIVCFKINVIAHTSIISLPRTKPLKTPFSCVISDILIHFIYIHNAQLSTYIYCALYLLTFNYIHNIFIFISALIWYNDIKILYNMHKNKLLFLYKNKWKTIDI